MKIIALKPRRKSLTGVEFDQPVEPELFLAETDAAGLIALDSELCEMKRLSAGMELTDEELESLVSQSHIKRAKSRAMWYLSRSSYPKAGLIKKLCASFPDYAAEAAADRMEELGLINDRDYAGRRLERLMADKGMSLKMALYTLSTEGIDRELLSALKEEKEYEYDPVRAVTEIYERRFKNKLRSQKDVDRMMEAFVRKGFSAQTVKRALEEAGEDVFDTENTEF